MSLLFCVGSTEVITDDSRRTFSPLHFLSIRTRNSRLNDNYFTIHTRDIENTEITEPELSHIHDDAVLPWACQCNYFWRDLGERFFPRFVRDAECGQQNCWFGHFDCIPQLYEIYVLKQIERSNIPLLDFSPRFREDFVYTAVNVTVNCNCGRSNSYS